MILQTWTRDCMLGARRDSTCLSVLLAGLDLKWKRIWFSNQTSLLFLLPLYHCLEGFPNRNSSKEWQDIGIQ